MTKKILVTGGLGYIGSHTVVELQQEGFEVFIIDNLSNSSIDVLDKIESITSLRPTFVNLDLKNRQAIQTFLATHQPDGVIHFAASKAVGESVQKPLDYYENNITSLVYLLQELNKHNVSPFIFSSSCTVYGQAEKMPISEEAPIKPATSPYGFTKQIGEKMIEDVTQVTELKAISLRYFNPIGAHPSAQIGELPLGVPQNLVPFVTQTAAGIRNQIQIFGNDYPTPDGTAIRDYIHVVDLAKAHIVALKRILFKKQKKNYEVFNIGTGKGNSVLEIINSFKKVNQLTLKHQYAPRRTGDITIAYANTSLANKELGWKAEISLEQALKDAWKWQQKLS